VPCLTIFLIVRISSFESWYRNPLSDVRSFLDEYHSGSYAMVNLCDERDYRDTDWPGAARVMRYPFADHHSPALCALDAFCERAHAFMQGNASNVLAVHCKAGKGRTGVMVCAYLLYIQHIECPSADAALHYFRSTRTTDLDAVNQPSQVRCVRMYERLLQCESPRRAPMLTGCTIVLKAIVLSCAPGSIFWASSTSSPAPGSASESSASAASPSPSATTDVGSAINPWQLRVDVLSVHTMAPTADGVASVRRPISSCGPVRCVPLQPNVRLVLPGGGLRLRGDFELQLKHLGVLAEERLGWATLHTSFLPHVLLPLPEGGALPVNDVDGAAKDCSRFPRDWRLVLEFTVEAE